jgi:hypothetical protein
MHSNIINIDVIRMVLLISMCMQIDVIRIVFLISMSMHDIHNKNGIFNLYVHV